MTLSGRFSIPSVNVDWNRFVCKNVLISGYRIVAIMSPCQGLDTGSTPVTRSTTQLNSFLETFHKDLFLL